MLVRPPTRIQSRPRYPKKTDVKHSLCWEERAGQDETSKQRDRGLEQLRVKCFVSLCLIERPASQKSSKPASQPVTGSIHGFLACGRARVYKEQMLASNRVWVNLSKTIRHYPKRLYELTVTHTIKHTVNTQ